MGGLLLFFFLPHYFTLYWYHTALHQSPDIPRFFKAHYFLKPREDIGAILAQAEKWEPERHDVHRKRNGTRRQRLWVTWAMIVMSLPWLSGDVSHSEDWDVCWTFFCCLEEPWYCSPEIEMGIAGWAIMVKSPVILVVSRLPIWWSEFGTSNLLDPYPSTRADGEPKSPIGEWWLQNLSMWDVTFPIIRLRFAVRTPVDTDKQRLYSFRLPHGLDCVHPQNFA